MGQSILLRQMSFQIKIDQCIKHTITTHTPISEHIWLHLANQ